MQSHDRVRLKHMLEAVDEAISFIKGETRDSLETERMLEFALVRAIEIIGEAASQVTQGYKETCPQVQWNSIVGMRNRLIHAYFDVNRDILWKTVVDDLPTLREELQKLLK